MNKNKFLTLGLLSGLGLLVLSLVAGVSRSYAGPCFPTGDPGSYTAALVNPTGTVAGDVDATGCDVGVYYNTGSGSIEKANIFGASFFEVYVNGNASHVEVDITDSHFAGGFISILWRAFISGSVTGTISGNTFTAYSKSAIVTNGKGITVNIFGNSATGLGPTNAIAQNGIQIGYGASASVMRNTVIGHSYTGTSTVASGIVVVGGPGYGDCPFGSGKPCPFTTGTQIIQNTVIDNDIGVFLTNLDNDPNFIPPVATNIKAVNNFITDAALTNNYGGFGYQAGVSDVGNNDKIINNKIGGTGYDPAANPGAYTVRVDADVSFTARPKVHATKDEDGHLLQ